MKKTNFNILGCFLAVVGCLLSTSCAMDAPFNQRGEGSLRLTTEIRGDYEKTRSVSSEDLASLRKKCVVYIENSKGVIRKYKGVDNIPEHIQLAIGDYVAEGWSGDSVSASFDAKFYRGYQRFEISEGDNSLTLRCNIANVIVSVAPESLDINLKELKVTFSHSRGSLVFDESNIISAKGYFMMPNADKDLDYKIEGVRNNGDSYEKCGKIMGVQRAHEYVVTLTEDETQITEGGALIKLEIQDIPVIEEEVEIFTAPTVSGIGCNIDKQIVAKNSSFNDTRVYIKGYFGLSSVLMNFSNNFSGFVSGQNILQGDVIANLKEKGILIERTTSEDASSSLENGKVLVDELYVTFTSQFLNGLAPSDVEYSVTFEATDARHLTNVGVVRFANTENAVEHIDPVGANEMPDPVSSPMTVLAKSATLSASIYDSEKATNPGINYRKAGESAWIPAYPSSRSMLNATRGECIPYSVIVTGLEPSTTYEYAAFCDGFQSSDIKTFTTETPWIIPNSSFEDWSSYSASTLLGTKTVVLPWSEGDKNASYWGSGNEGSATAGLTLTDKSTDLLHSGTYSVRLESNKAMGIIAAGNLFVGTYVKTDGTNGVLSLGRQYNSSHPEKLTVWANYRPASGVTVKSGNEGFVPNGFADGLDHGQIYVALTTEQVEIRTNPNDRKLFEESDPVVLAYGQVTWTGNIGPDGALEKIEIPLSYKASARNTEAKYLVIVASASKYGDYFSGAKGSVMYLDDFQLEY